MPRRDHVVVVGLGQVGLRLCLLLRECGVAVVAVDTEAEGENVGLARRLKLPVVIGRGANPDLLRRLSLQRARSLAAVTPDDLSNIEAAVAARAVDADLRVVLRAGDGEVADETRSLEQIGHVLDVHRLGAAYIAGLALGKDADAVAIRNGRPQLALADGRWEEFPLEIAKGGSAASSHRCSRKFASVNAVEMFFDGFALERFDVGAAVLRVRHGGDGPPVVLLHGHPRTHTTWHRVAPLLVRAGHTVVCPDLRGYGELRGEADYSKRAMAGDVHALMGALGFPRFAVAGHDRGSCVAHRLAVDFPDAVTRLAVLDSVPIAEALDRCDARFAQSWWHWFFFAQTAKPAEAIISRDPEAWYSVDATQMGAENHADWRRAVNNPDVVRAMVGDYRAGVGSTAPTKTRTGQPGDGSRARRWRRGRYTTTSRSSTATRWPSGGHGSRVRCAGSGSTPGTTWQRRPRSSSRACWRSSWRDRPARDGVEGARAPAAAEGCRLPRTPWPGARQPPRRRPRRLAPGPLARAAPVARGRARGRRARGPHRGVLAR